MENIISGVIGAVVGALVTGLIAWRLQASKSKGEQKWTVAWSVSQTLGSILSAYTPDSLKHKEDVWKLQQEWGRKARELHILGFTGGTDDPLTKTVNEYCEALLAYVEGDMPRGVLEHKRTYAKEQARKYVEKFMH